MDTQSRQKNSRTGTDWRRVRGLHYLFCGLAFVFLVSGCATHRAQPDAEPSDSSSSAVEPRKGSEKLAVVAPLKTVSDSRPPRLAPARSQALVAKSTLESPKAAEQQPVTAHAASPKVVSAQVKTVTKPAELPAEAPISDEITAKEAIPPNALIFKGPNPVAAAVAIRKSTPWFLIWVGVSFVVILIGAAIWRALQRSARPEISSPNGSRAGKLSLQGAPKGPETGLGE